MHAVEQDRDQDPSLALGRQVGPDARRVVVGGTVNRLEPVRRRQQDVAVAVAQGDEAHREIGGDKMGARVIERQPVDFEATLRAMVGAPGRAGDEDHRASDVAPFEAPPISRLGTAAGQPFDLVGLERHGLGDEAGRKFPGRWRLRQSGLRPWGIDKCHRQDGHRQDGGQPDRAGEFW